VLGKREVFAFVIEVEALKTDILWFQALLVGERVVALD